jgi:hypothetical protein
MKMSSYLVLVCILVGLRSIAQQTETSKANQQPELTQTPAGVAALEFSKPKAVSDLVSQPIIVGRFDCSDDGSIITLIDGYALSSGTTPAARIALLAIHPDGTVTNFPWRSVPGFDSISLPKSVFVGNGHVYVLVQGATHSQLQEKKPPHSLVLTFNGDGSLAGKTILEQDLEPLVLGVFPSGNFLLLSEDRLNHRVAANLVSPDGMALRDLRMEDSDFVATAARMPAGARSPSAYSESLLIAMSKFYLSGNNLLLVPLATFGLPIIELDEHGVVRSVLANLPDKTVLDAFVSASTSSWKVLLGKVVENDTEALHSQGKLLGVSTQPSQRIAEFSRADGKLIREIEIGGQGIAPACESNGNFRFLTSSMGQGRLQFVTAHIR